MKKDTSLTSDVEIVGVIKLRHASQYFHDDNQIAIIHEKDGNYFYILVDEVFHSDGIDGMSLVVKAENFLNTRVHEKNRFPSIKNIFR